MLRYAQFVLVAMPAIQLYNKFSIGLRIAARIKPIYNSLRANKKCILAVTMAGQIFNLLQIAIIFIIIWLFLFDREYD